MIDRLTEYVANVRQPMNASYGYDRLHVLLNKSAEMLNFFEFLGFMFTNGTLGLCIDDVSKDVLNIKTLKRN